MSSATVSSHWAHDSPDNPATNGELAFSKTLVPRCRTVFDVGARTDDYLVGLNSDCQFHLFEPMPESVAQLRAKTDGHSNVVVVDSALGEINGSQFIHPDTQSIQQRPHGVEAKVPITIQRMDDYCEAHSIEHIDFLKIDVEGHELSVLKGGENAVRTLVETIQFEYGGTYSDAGIKLADVFEFLGSEWYFYKLESDGLLPVLKYRSSLENFQYANYVASRSPLAAKKPVSWWTSACQKMLGRKAAA